MNCAEKERSMLRMLAAISCVLLLLNIAPTLVGFARDTASLVGPWRIFELPDNAAFGHDSAPSESKEKS